MKFFSKIIILFILFIISCSESPTKFIEFSYPAILFVSDYSEPIHTDYYQMLTIVDANGNHKVDVYKNLNNYISDPSFSGDGEKIVFVMGLDSIDGSAIFTINFDGSNLEKISKDYIYQPNLSIYGLRFMPDNINIVYLLRTSERNWEIRFLNCNTKEDKLVCNGYFYGLLPEITADGEWIIFWENNDLYKINIFDGTKYKITNGNVSADRYHLCKQNNELVFRTSNRHIAKIKIDGTDYIKYNFEGQFPRISNDGKIILYMAIGEEQPSIWIYDVDKNLSNIVISYYTWDEFADFFPSDQRIIFLRNLNENKHIFTCDYNGNGLKEIGDVSEFSFQYLQFKL